MTLQCQMRQQGMVTGWFIARRHRAITAVDCTQGSRINRIYKTNIAGRWPTADGRWAMRYMGELPLLEHDHGIHKHDGECEVVVPRDKHFAE